jgi:hypothetical protein
VLDDHVTGAVGTAPPRLAWRPGVSAMPLIWSWSACTKIHPAMAPARVGNSSRSSGGRWPALGLWARRPSIDRVYDQPDHLTCGTTHMGDTPSTTTPTQWSCPGRATQTEPRLGV